MNKKIFLLSDVVRHVYLKLTNDNKSQHEKKGEYTVYTQNMNGEGDTIECSPIIKDMLLKAIKDADDGNILPKYTFNRKSDKPSLNLFRILHSFPRTSNKSDDKKVFRVNHNAEYFGSKLTLVPELGVSSDHEIMKELFKNMQEADKQSINLFALYDRNSELRKYIEYIYNGNDPDKRVMLNNLINQYPIKAIIIGIKEEVNNEKWLKILNELTDNKKNRCIVIITADDLRNSGLNITEHGTIEQNIREVVANLHRKPLNLIWDVICQHLVVIFRENQALYLNKQLSKGTYHYCPYFDRPAQIRPEQYGKMPGKFTIKVTSIAKYLFQNSATYLNGDLWDELVNKALRFGIVAYNDYFDNGYCASAKISETQIQIRAEPKTNTNFVTEVKTKSPFDAINYAVDYRREKMLYDNSWNIKEYYVSSLDFSIAQIKHDIAKRNRLHDFNLYDRAKGLTETIWGRSDALFKYYTDPNLIIDKLDLKDEFIRYEDKQKFVLHSIVRHGLEAVTYKPKGDDPISFNDFDDYRIICPHLELEGMKIIDEDHMNNFIDLAQLLRTYLSSHNKIEQPLSIAVFGPPGEGKSFSIKQIIKHVSPERKSEDLTFNLAQFASIDQLTEAFHQIQDRVLKHPGEPPLIIFDEFDAKLGEQELGWLKFFLAPMQDDLFRGKSVEYKIGQAIFVFSGGTSKCFQDFKDKLKNPNEENDRKAVKLDDFIGRLKGFMDVKGINTTESNISRTVKLRRAIVLRSLLKRNAKYIFLTDGKTARIHDDVIDAFLETTQYIFGIRSMEAIISMSRWIDKAYVPASLPSLNQLEMHVEPQAFKRVIFDKNT